MYTPVHPSFTIQKWGVRGYSLHGLVFVMGTEKNICPSCHSLKAQGVPNLHAEEAIRCVFDDI